MQKRSLFIVVLISLVIVSGVLFSTHGALFDTSFIGKGDQRFVFSLSTWGRYSIQVQSQEGVGLSVMDKKNGTLRSDGLAGQRNGRVDLFLEKGQYRITTASAARGTAKARLTVLQFASPADEKPSLLIADKLTQSELADLAQVSYWIEAVQDTTMEVVGCGRNLTDLVIWKDGQWMIDAQSQRFSSFPGKETPLKGVRLKARLTRG
ncbi:MAG: hypothetical protein JW795_07690, partial [Chitinivibrionales bacterium]|nr:hypothetical protein [Chitinivibrionales bacterium]